MARRSTGGTRRRESVPDLVRRHSSLLASLNGDGVREERRSERRRSTVDLEREFPNLRPSHRPSNCQSIAEEETQSLSIEELEQLLDNCTKLTKNNQLTEGRLWGLALPQHMPDLVRQNADQALFNFQKVDHSMAVQCIVLKVSFGLDAAVQIYSKRVDSMHNSALDTRSRLTTQQKQNQKSNGEENVEGSAIRRVRRHSDFGGDATLATTMESINAKDDGDDPLPIDPLFQKTSALFNAGGYKGLPTLKLGIKKGGRYVLDTTEIPGKGTYRACELPYDHQLDLVALGMRFESSTDILPLAPSTSKLLAMLNRPENNHSVRELIQRGMNAVALPPRPLSADENGITDVSEANREHGMEQQMEAPATEMQDDTGFPDDDQSVFRPALNDDDGIRDYNRQEGFDDPPMEMGDGGHFSFTPDVVDAFNCGELSEDVEVLDAETISWLMDPKHDKGTNKSRAWTGASHWKYPQASTRPEPRDSEDPQPRRRETRAFIDFVNLPETELSRFKKADRESNISAQTKDDDPHLLPHDYRLDASVLLQLPLLPSLKPEGWLWRFQRVRNQQNMDDGDWDIGGNDFDRGMDDWGNDGHPISFDLIQAPPAIDEDNIQIEAAPNRIDMDMLKKRMWREIELLDRKEIPLNDLVRPATEELEVSFGICFSCALHLAIEHGFHLVDNAEADVVIVLDD